MRDDDHIGGHIHTSTHVPSRGLDAQLPALVRSLAEKEVVVFHCALSQQRGPAAAGSYLRERAKGRSAGVNGEKGGDGEKGGVEEVKSEEGVVRGTEGGEDWKGEEGEEGERVKGAVGGQKVYVLDGGFVRWQERYVSRSILSIPWRGFC